MTSTSAECAADSLYFVMVISVEQAKAQLDALIDRSSAGEEVFITRNGRLVARVVAAGTADAGHGNGIGNGNGDASHETASITTDRAVPTTPPTTPEPRRLGSAKGLIHIADNFDAPLEEFREYME